MKDKKYESPKAEKLDFNYADAVTASGTGSQPEAPVITNSGERLEQVWVGNQTFPSSTNCAKQWRYVSNC